MLGSVVDVITVCVVRIFVDVGLLGWRVFQLVPCSKVGKSHTLMPATTLGRQNAEPIDDIEEGDVVG